MMSRVFYLVAQFGLVCIRVLLRPILGKSRRNNFLRSRNWNSWTVFIFLINILRVPELMSYTGLAEPEVVKIMLSLHSRTAIDIGANIGRYTGLLAKTASLALAIEPTPRTFAILKRNMKHKKNIICIQKAIMAQVGKINFYLSLSASDMNSIRKISEGKAIEVSTTTLDNLMIQYFYHKTVDLVKIDVEGAEFEVLKGSQLMGHLVQNWIVELHIEERKLELEDWFKDRGYRLKWLDKTRLWATKDLYR
ncbi:MAG: FkbM family methyltransferase [Thaumarchaeota archaeon]|nr:MAG: FkbM family methyltransferase [Nitrososphaerota archaeon]